MIKLNFQPKQAAKNILLFLDKKPRNILEQRFGLKSSNEASKTLEAIGQGYGITRERVRQIEEDALKRLRKSEGFSRLGDVFKDLKEKIEARGKIVNEKAFLGEISNEPSIKQHIRFFLVLGEDFEHLKEDDEFYRRWTTDADTAEQIQKALRSFHQELSPDDLLSEKEILARFLRHFKSEILLSATEEILSNILKISRLIDMNPVGEWGRVSSPAVRPRGVRDLAFLAMRKHGSPMHFQETAETIAKIFGRPVNTQTVHNELIKDGRFVLVGRGLYALKEWGYESGIVKDVIRKVLAAGPLSKEDIVKSVMKERYVKENTILINLQNGKYFRKNSDGAYISID